MAGKQDMLFFTEITALLTIVLVLMVGYDGNTTDWQGCGIRTSLLKADVVDVKVGLGDFEDDNLIKRQDN